MKIIVDSREQKKLKFSHSLIKEVVVEKLDFGDYAVEFEDGYMPPIVFERKSLSDAFSTFTHNWERFKNELSRAKQANVMLVVIIEATLSRVRLGDSHSNRPPSSLLAQIFYSSIKYDFKTVFCSNSEETADYIIQSFIAYQKHHVNSERGQG